MPKGGNAVDAALKAASIWRTLCDAEQLVSISVDSFGELMIHVDKDTGPRVLERLNDIGAVITNHGAHLDGFKNVTLGRLQFVLCW